MRKKDTGYKASNIRDKEKLSENENSLSSTKSLNHHRNFIPRKERIKSADLQFMYNPGQGIKISVSAHQLEKTRAESSLSQPARSEPGVNSLEIPNYVADTSSSSTSKNFRILDAERESKIINLSQERKNQNIGFQQDVRYSRYGDGIPWDQNRLNFKPNTSTTVHFQEKENLDLRKEYKVESPTRNLNDRQVLCLEWAGLGHWFRHQPLWLIRIYFGSKIGMYFAWLEFYTQALVAPAVLGTRRLFILNIEFL